jgi:ribonuclease P protein component
MKKDQNRSDSDKPDQSLPRSKILRGRRNFQRLFEKSTVLTSDSIQFRYRLYNDPSEGCLVGFIAPKKTIPGAVQRNRAKRLMREVYRIHQYFVEDLFSSKRFGFHGAFLARKAGLSFSQVQKEMLPLLQEVRDKLLEAELRQLKSNSPSATNTNSETKQA